MQVAPGTRVPGSQLADRMRPKLVAIRVSGCHLVPVIVRASGRGRQARAGGHGQRDVTQPQDLGRVATGKSLRSIAQTGIAGAARPWWSFRPVP